MKRIPKHVRRNGHALPTSTGIGGVRPFGVYSSDYPEDGSHPVMALNKEDAMREYTRETGMSAEGMEAIPLTKAQYVRLKRA